MEQLAQQWPLLAGFVAITAALLKIIQGLYERMIDDLREERDQYRDLALNGTEMAEREVAHRERERGERQGRRR